MKYNPPYGSTDPNAAYVDRSTPNAQSGSKVPRQAVEHSQREIVHCITQMGMTPSESDLTQLWQAIEMRIESVRVNMLVYPEIQTSDGKIPVTAFAPGTIRIPAGVSFIMRGSKQFTTVQTDRNTLANTTYHLRWSEDDGFLLKSASDTGYNPGGVVNNEVNASFDTAYDDMLVARVVTDGSNVSTITNLVNKVDLATEVKKGLALPDARSWATLANSGTTLDWARRPKFGQPLIQGARSFNADMDGTTHADAAGIWRAFGLRIPAGSSVTRYGAPNLQYAYEDSATNEGWLDFIWTFFA